MIGINCISRLSDLKGTFCYELCFDREYTVQEFLDLLMSNENQVDWLSVKISDEKEDELIRIGYNKRVHRQIKLAYNDSFITKARFSEEYGSLIFHLVIKNVI